MISPISAGMDGLFVYQRLYKSCEYLQYLQYLHYLHEAHKHIRGSQKKSFLFSAFARLFDEEKETNNAEIPQVLTFILLSAGLRLYGETCVVGSEKTHEDEGSTSWI